MTNTTVWGQHAIGEVEGVDAINKSYGRDFDDPHFCGHRFTIAEDGTVMALVAGDMGYESTHIVIPRSHILALVEDWPELQADEYKEPKE